MQPQVLFCTHNKIKYNQSAQIDRVKRRVVSCASRGAVGWLQSLSRLFRG